MKFSTVLGTFALSTLEAYRAFASPLEPEAHSLESRRTEYCCVQTQIDGNTQSSFVSYPLDGLKGQVASSGECVIVVNQTSTPPSKGGCSQWVFEAVNCDDYQNPSAFVEDAQVCKK
ncbi:hypothetical protein E4U24_007532 [Claviceps purpurea]|nr:hypothetical protein E4U38_003675 [Claviceps purpurea]KAG6162837.1 hypothetical protein E4U51_006131 [Claviceps purpurea]KAG6163923.1 hypothetical protein E4U11_001577 [Claviceps purpurea]KAG6176361.1 hypothetical protein E4U27_005256 [Claviceps purpurea]KAG6195369.1 hypothetical protein E4U10_001933 [Claviceps purpurea]